MSDIPGKGIVIGKGPEDLMDVSYKLFKHQKELLACKDDMVYMRAGRGSGKSFIASLIAVLALLKGQRVLIMAQDYRALTEVIMAERAP